MSKNVILSFMGAAIAVLLAGLIANVHRPASIGYYDAARVYGGSREAKAAVDAVEVKTKDQLAAAQKATGEYQAAVKEKGGAGLEAASGSIDPVLAAKKSAAAAAGDAFKKADDAARSAVAEQVDRRVSEAVAKIAVARGMSLVMAITGKMAFAAPECDLTQDIIVAVDAAGPVK